ncbi:MAG: hypothetical protein KF768_07115 [Phycisphaeraceae bacterium]|nr:hypothetical protein [Phycisphaeraceae bacterium]
MLPGTLITNTSGKPIDVARLARMHRRVLITFWIVSIAPGLLILALAGATAGPLVGMFLGVAALTLGCSAALPPAAAFLSWRLGASRTGIAMVTLLAMLPGVSVLIWLALNDRVKAILWQSGLAVGHFGASPSDIRKLNTGTCFKCNYDLSGLPSRICPECGTISPYTQTRTSSARCT